MLWINDCLLVLSDVEGTSAVLIAPLTIPGTLVGGGMQHPQLHSSLQQLPYQISMATLMKHHTPHFDAVLHAMIVCLLSIQSCLLKNMVRTGNTVLVQYMASTLCR